MVTDAEWVAEAYVAHADAVYRLARLIVADPEDARDVTQLVFERALARRASYDPSRPLRPWLLGIAGHESLHLRRGLRLRRHRALDGTIEAPLSPPAGEVWTAVQRLGAGHRLVVGLFYVHGYSMEEIAGIAGIPVGTVASRLHTARRRLRAMLEGEGRAEVLQL